VQVAAQLHPSSSEHVAKQVSNGVLIPSVAEHFPPTQKVLAQSPATAQVFPFVVLPQVCVFVVVLIVQVVGQLHPSSSEHVAKQVSSGVLIPSVAEHFPATQKLLAHSVGIAHIFPSVFPPHVCVLVIVVCAQSVEHVHPSSSLHVAVHEVCMVGVPSVHVPLGQCALAQSPSVVHVAASLFFPQVCVLVVVVSVQVAAQSHPSSSEHVAKQVSNSVLIPSVGEHFPLTQKLLAQSPATAQLFPLVV